MQRARRPFQPDLLRRRTWLSNREIADYLKKAERLSGDLDQAKRRAAQQCKVCFYLRAGRLAGAAMTSEPCACCGVSQMYGSTATNLLCNPCANKHNLCIGCGADVEGNEGREEWPPAAKTPAEAAD